MQWNITHTKNLIGEGKVAPAHSDKKTFSCSSRKPPPHPYTTEFVAHVRTRLGLRPVLWCEMDGMIF